MAGAYNGPANFPDWTVLDHALMGINERSATMKNAFSNKTGKLAFIVFYNNEAPEVEGKQQRGKVQMSPLTFNTVIEAMREMATTGSCAGQERVDIQIKSQYAGQVRLESPRVEGRVVITIKAGVIGVTPIDGNKQPLTFKMLPPHLTCDIVDAEKTPIELAQQSRLFTIAWCNMMQQVANQLVAIKTEEKQRKDQQRAPRQNSAPANQDYDDDIAF